MPLSETTPDPDLLSCLHRYTSHRIHLVLPLPSSYLEPGSLHLAVILLECLIVQPYYCACNLFPALWRQRVDNSCNGATPVSTFHLSDASLAILEYH
jgi:hypothetical protein